MAQTRMNLLAALLDRTRTRTRTRKGERIAPGVDQEGALSATFQRALPLIKAEQVPRYHFPLINHGRQILEPRVGFGETVTAGQLLAEGIVSSVEGTVESIAAQPFAHPSGLPVLSVTIRAMPAPESSGEQKAASHQSWTPALTIEQLRRCGVSGLGGAGYSTADKLSAVRQHDIHTLLINAAECDPSIRCDEALMTSEPDSIIRGIRHLITLSRCQNCIIAVENDKSYAIAALRSILEGASTTEYKASIELRLIDPVYPSGAERMLIRLMCGIDVVPPMRPADYGVLCVNVGTAYAAGRAAEGLALTTRIVTVGGPAATNPCNVRARLGTPLIALIQDSGNHYSPEHHRLRIGGSVSGFELHDARASVTAMTNCLTIEERHPKPAALACIRCGACSDACPVDLLPQQLYWHIQADDLEGAARQCLDHCIECACCDQVCPSGIELTNHFRYARSERRIRSSQERDADMARQRHESHARREGVRDALAQDQIRERKAALNDRATAAKAALERVRNRRKRSSQ